MKAGPARTALAAAVELARDLGLLALERVLHGELERLDAPPLRLLVIGPTSAGKTSTILSLLGDAGLGPDGEPLLPVAVEPTTAHAIDLATGAPSWSATFLYADGRTAEPTDLEGLRAQLRTPSPALQRVLLDLPGEAGLPPGTMLCDTPGVASDGGAYADALVEEELVTADVVLFHLRCTRGLGPARALLQRIAATYPYPADLARRLVVVLTDVRSAARAQELEEELPALLGARPVFVQVPRRGEVAALRALLEKKLQDPEVVPTSERRARALLTGLALPELRGALVARRAAVARAEETRKHLEGFVSLGQETVASLRRLSAEARSAVTRDLNAGLEVATAAIRQEVAVLAEGMERLLWETYRDEVARTVQARTDTFHAQASETLDEALRRLSDRCNALLAGFEQAVSMPAELAEVPGLDLATEAALNLAAGRAARQALAYVQRMGGRGGAALGTVNVARKVVARFYRLGGRKAPAELIRRGVPRVMRPAGQLFKFVAKRVWIIDLAIEAVRIVWNTARAKAVTRNFADELLEQWHEGPPLSLWGKLRGQERPPGIRVKLDELVKDAWEGCRRDGQVWPGMQAQLDSAGEEIGRQVEAWRTELAGLDSRTSVDALGLRLEQLEAGLELGGADHG